MFYYKKNNVVDYWYIFINIQVIFSTQCEFSRVSHYLVLLGEDIFFNNEISKQDNWRLWYLLDLSTVFQWTSWRSFTTPDWSIRGLDASKLFEMVQSSLLVLFQENDLLVVCQGSLY